MNDDTSEAKKRKKVVVEEVVDETPEKVQEEPLEEIKEKAQEIEKLAEEASAPVIPATAPEPPPQPMSSGPSPLVIIIPGIFLLGGLLGGILFYQNRVSSKDVYASPTPVVTESSGVTATATPTPKEVDITKYEISVQNGSGIGGEAGRAQALLEKAGFKVSDTGNASNYDYTKTVIQAKSTIEKDFLTKLSEALGKTYSVDTKTQSLASSSDNSVVVIIGSSKK